MADPDEEGANQLLDSSTTFELDDSFVAPWGLAGEERPMHLLWSGPIKSLELQFAEPVDLVEAYNLVGDVDDFMCTESRTGGVDVQNLVLHEDDFSTPGYLNIKFRIPQIYEEAMVGQKIGVTFHLTNGRTRKLEEYTFTIRPQIEAVDAPERLTLEDTSEIDSIDLKMRYIGFGMAQVGVEAEGEGELISQGESLYHDLAAALIASGIHEKESEQLGDIPEEWKQETGVEIPDKTLEEIVQGIRDLLSEGTALDEFDEKELRELAGVLEDGNEKYEITPMYEHIEMLLLNSILDVVDRHPTENVQLSNPHTKVEIKSRMHGILVRYRLRDNHGNEYEPVEIPIEVEDTRENGGVIEAEINTEWEHHQLDPDEILTTIMEDI